MLLRPFRCLAKKYLLYLLSAVLSLTLLPPPQTTRPFPSFLAPKSTLSTQQKITAPVFDYSSNAIGEAHFFLETGLDELSKQKQPLSSENKKYVNQLLDELFKAYFYFIGFVKSDSFKNKKLFLFEEKIQHLQFALKAAVGYKLYAQKLLIRTNEADQKWELISQSLDSFLVEVLPELFDIQNKEASEGRKVKRIVQNGQKQKMFRSLFSFEEEELFQSLLNEIKKGTKISSKLLPYCNELVPNISHTTEFVSVPRSLGEENRLIEACLNESFYAELFSYKNGAILSKDRVRARWEQTRNIVETIKLFLKYADFQFNKTKQSFEWSFAKKGGKSVEAFPIASIYITGSSLWSLSNIPPGDMDLVVVVEAKENIAYRVNNLDLAQIRAALEEKGESVTQSPIVIERKNLNKMDVSILSTGYLKSTDESHRIRLITLYGTALPLDGKDLIGEWKPNHHDVFQSVWSLSSHARELISENTIKAAKRLLEAALKANRGVQIFNEKYRDSTRYHLEPISKETLLAVAENLVTEDKVQKNRLLELSKQIEQLYLAQMQNELQIFGEKKFSQVFDRILKKSPTEKKEKFSLDKTGRGVEVSL